MNVSPGVFNGNRVDWKVDILSELRAAHGPWLRPSLRTVELLWLTRESIAVLHVVSTDGDDSGWIPLDFIDDDESGEKMFPPEWSKERCVREFLGMNPLTMARCFSGFLFTFEGWCEIVVRYGGEARRIEA